MVEEPGIGIEEPGIGIGMTSAVLARMGIVLVMDGGAVTS